MRLSPDNRHTMSSSGNRFRRASAPPFRRSPPAALRRSTLRRSGKSFAWDRPPPSRKLFRHWTPATFWTGTKVATSFWTRCFLGGSEEERHSLELRYLVLRQRA